MGKGRGGGGGVIGDGWLVTRKEWERVGGIIGDGWLVTGKEWERVGGSLEMVGQ